MKKGEKLEKKIEETGRNGETEDKTRPKVKTMIYLLFTLLVFKPIKSHFFLVKTCVLMKTFFFRKTFFFENMFLGEIMFFFVKICFFGENICFGKNTFLGKT